MTPANEMAISIEQLFMNNEYIMANPNTQSFIREIVVCTLFQCTRDNLNTHRTFAISALKYAY